MGAFTISIIIVLTITSLLFITLSVVQAFRIHKLILKCRKKTPEKSIKFFGEYISKLDLLSFVNSCVALLMCPENHQVDLTKIINEDKLFSIEDESRKRSLVMLTMLINSYPFIHCKVIEDNNQYIIVLDNNKTYDKIKQYNDKIQSYGIPLPIFDIGVLERNRRIFSLTVKKHQSEILKSIISLPLLYGSFEELSSIIEKFNYEELKEAMKRDCNSIKDVYGNVTNLSKSA